MKGIGNLFIVLFWGVPNFITLYYIVNDNQNYFSKATFSLIIITAALNFSIMGCLLKDVFMKD
jgi:hypothetical protein